MLGVELWYVEPNVHVWYLVVVEERYRAERCYAMLYHVMPCYAMLCHV